MLRLNQRILPVIVLVLGLTFFIGQAQSNTSVPTVRLFAEGLRNPAGITAHSSGVVFIAEEGTGGNDLSAGVSMRLPDGSLGRLVSGLPSGRDSGDLSGVAMVGISPDESTLYIGNFGAGHLWTIDLTTLDLTVLPDRPLMPAQLGTAMQPLNRVTLTNPFDITFDADGVPVVADSSQDGVAKETADGKTLYIHRFASLGQQGDYIISPVPTGIERVDDEYYVTLTGGCPFPQGSGELVAIDEDRNQRTVLDGLNMPIAIERAPDGTLWMLEFARFGDDASCFSGQGYLPNTGRLSRILADGTRETVVDNLDFPVGLQVMSDDRLIVSEIFDGELVEINLSDVTVETQSSFTPPELVIDAPQYNDISDFDAALRTVIEAQNLQAFPGLDVKEGDTEIAALGRDLFFDPILSGDKNISCATCHHPAFTMGDGRVLPIGSGGIGLGNDRDFLTHIRLSEEYIGAEAGQIVPNPAIGEFVPRNSPTVLNSALLNAQFWDGRVQNYARDTAVITLENAVNELGITDPIVAQALFPVTSRAEMSGATLGEEQPEVKRQMLTQRLEQNDIYNDRFQEIFETDVITPAQIALAVGAFERQLIFTESPWDNYIAGDMSALTDAQKRGALLFYGALNPQVNCSVCHSGDLLTDQAFHNLLVPQLGPGKGNGDNGREDWGRANVTFDWRDRFKFRTPSLRNVTLTAPYFHTGAYATLEAVIAHHANIWASAQNYDPSAHLPQEFYSSLRPIDLESQHHTVAPELANGLPLTNGDIADLVAFLESLTDPSAVNLAYLTPETVPSGLLLDPVPDANTQRADISDAYLEVEEIESADTPQAFDGNLRFYDVSDIRGIDFEHGAFQLGYYEDPIAMMGAGLCWIDYDKDGWLDLYLVNSHSEAEIEFLQANDGLPQNALYRNDRGRFSEVEANGTQLAMRGNGCVSADFNLDGWYDLYVTADGDDVLLLNQQDGTFADVTKSAGISAPEWNTTAIVADVNKDGLPDLFVGAYIDLDNKIPNPFGAFPQDYYGIPDRLFLNQGIADDGTVSFLEVTSDVGLVREERTLGAIFSDVDRDGDLDLYVANDGQPNRLYENIPDDSAYGFHFVDLTDTAEVGDAGSGMGVTGADYDNDGMFDLFVTNWEAELNALYRNETHEEGFINFRYSTYRIGMRGLGNNMTGWGTKWADFDHDTDIDLITVNGRVPVTNFATDPELVRYYRNHLVETGRPEYFEWTQQVGLEDVGTFLARGSAVADYDNDGDLDIAMNTIAHKAVLLENTGVHSNWLQVEFEDFLPGTVVKLLLPDGSEFVSELHAGSSYLASEDPRMHFGLGDADTIESLLVIFPDGTEQIRTGVQVNTVMKVTR